MEDKVILTVKEINWGLVCYPIDDWVATTRTVYDNGTVQTHVQRTLSGINYSGVNGISEEKFSRLKELLVNFAELKGENNLSVCDGTGYEITSYTKKDKAEVYSGYIYGNEYLEEIVKIASCH